MGFASLIEDLGNLQAPNRRADERIALAIGMRERRQTFREKGEIKEQVYWYLGEKAFPRIPLFTSSLDAAMVAVEMVAPFTLGVAFRRFGKGSAVLNEGEHFDAATPAIALCMAVLKEMENKA
ncbi:hypothetical protein I6F07_03595 [Ensifer sp. IC4062]|nr:hypothetical protein [Ensifer sp. IC4062]MCA1439322.1 hypothetical protein [Ensifer sp. IC4062]